jgi:hypothetical protein
MKIESITFDTADSKLIISLEDGVSKEYTEATKDEYLAEHPDRAADIVAMGWAD